MELQTWSTNDFSYTIIAAAVLLTITFLHSSAVVVLVGTSYLCSMYLLTLPTYLCSFVGALQLSKISTTSVCQLYTINSCLSL